MKLLQAFILTYIEALCCKIFFETFWENTYNTDRRFYRIPFIGLVLGFMAVSLFPPDRYALKACTAMILITAIMLLEYHGNLIKIIFLSILYYGMVLCIDRIMLIFVHLATSSQAGSLFHEPVKGTMIALLCKTFLFLCILFIHRKFRRFEGFNLIADREWIRFLFFPAITIICMSAFAIDGRTGNRAMLIVALGMVLSNFFVFYIIRDVVNREKNTQDILLSRERLKNQMELYRFTDSANRKQRSQIHEFKNHLGCLQGLLKSQNYEEADRYISGIFHSLTEETDFINTNNTIVNSILNLKFKQARKKGILIIMVLSDLSKLPMKDEDIVILLSNLLDNGIEACAKISHAPRHIKLKFVYGNGKVIILLRNPAHKPEQTIEGRIVTTKPNKKDHGIGMINIQNTVNKYGGESIYIYHNGYFTHSVEIVF